MSSKLIKKHKKTKLRWGHVLQYFQKEEKKCVYNNFSWRSIEFGVDTSSGCFIRLQQPDITGCQVKKAILTVNQAFLKKRTTLSNYAYGVSWFAHNMYIPLWVDTYVHKKEIGDKLYMKRKHIELNGSFNFKNTKNNNRKCFKSVEI